MTDWWRFFPHSYVYSLSVSCVKLEPRYGEVLLSYVVILCLFQRLHLVLCIYDVLLKMKMMRYNTSYVFYYHAYGEPRPRTTLLLVYPAGYIIVTENAQHMYITNILRRNMESDIHLVTRYMLQENFRIFLSRNVFVARVLQISPTTQVSGRK